MDDAPQYNHLKNETSLYLKQHATNPVDWFPWGEEAFQKAIKEDKPIFLSIGYSTCHWCHVMEKESFQNTEIARLLNEHFISVKVDREELPGVDSLYMELSQVLNGHASGWPLNVLLTPDRMPFLSATYLPPTSKQGLIGLDQLLTEVHRLWKSEEKEHLIQQASHLIESYQKLEFPLSETLYNRAQLSEAVEKILQATDPLNGGLGKHPKFPQTWLLDFLLSYAHLHSDSRVLFWLQMTLDRMALGGIYDKLGGGFSRYAVDAGWQFPHFEKMLYDQAGLLRVYTRAYQLFERPFYQEICEGIVRYLKENLLAPSGGCYAAQDADSDGKEGAYYLWSLEELSSLFPAEDVGWVSRYFHLEAAQRAEEGMPLHALQTFEEWEKEHQDLPAQNLYPQWIGKLREAQKKRTHPAIDQKIITSWNALMARSLIEAGSGFGRKEWIAMGEGMLSFIEGMLTDSLQLFRRFCEGEKRFAGVLEDYAALLSAHLTAFEAGLGSSHLERAFHWHQEIEKRFAAPDGTYFQTDLSEPLISRRKDFHDGAEMSGNALQCENMWRWYGITQQASYKEAAEDLLEGAQFFMENFPEASGTFLAQMERRLSERFPQVWVFLDERNSLKNEIASIIFSTFQPYRSVIWKTEGDKILERFIPPLPLNEKPSQTMVVICRGNACTAPLLTLEAISHGLKEL